MTAIQITRTAGEKVFGIETIVQTIKAWHQHAKSRRQLAQISGRDLRDAGLSPLMVDFEVQQPFWRPLRNLRR